MPGTFDFTVDNLSAPDPYTVKTTCHRLRLIEKDRTATTLAAYNIYIPDEITAQAHQKLGGEDFILNRHEGYFLPNNKPFKVETVNVASRVFTVIED